MHTNCNERDELKVIASTENAPGVPFVAFPTIGMLGLVSRRFAMSVVRCCKAFRIVLVYRAFETRRIRFVLLGL